MVTASPWARGEEVAEPPLVADDENCGLLRRADLVALKLR
jgi:hypothetical protein